MIKNYSAVLLGAFSMGAAIANEGPVPPSPEEQLSLFKLPKGFKIELIASEVNGLVNPIDITFDDAGRAWTQTASMYPLDPLGSDIDFGKLVKIVGQDSKEEQDSNPEYKRIRDLYQLKTRGDDKVLMIQDPTQKVEGAINVFADGLTIPQSVLPYKNGVYVAHGSEMLFLEDTNNDGKADKHESVLTGFGFNDSHTLVHTLVRGPGGWVHFSQGALNNGVVEAVASGAKQRIDYSKIARFSLDGQKIELVSTGLNNIWGFQLDAKGQWYGTEANDMGASVVPMDPMTSFFGIGGYKIRDYQPLLPPPHSFRVGSTSISGLAFSDDDANAFPEEWRNLAFLANPRTNSINTVRLNRDGKGKIEGALLSDLVKTSDEWFRPVNIEFGPDGALYIVDFCNKVIGHNGVPEDNPNRDKKHGRLWRVSYEGQSSAIPNVASAQDAELVKHLSGASRWEKRAAWHQIADRKAVNLLPEIKALVLDVNQTTSTRVHALWAYESLGKFDHQLTAQLIGDQDASIRREAIRSLESFKIPREPLIPLLKPAIEDQHHAVRSQALRTLEVLDVANQDVVEMLVASCKPLVPGMGTGGPYERQYERYLARKALEKYSAELVVFLNSESVNNYPLANIFWVIQALPEKEFGKLFSKFWQRSNDRQIDADIFVTVANYIQNPEVASAVSSDFQNPQNYRPLLNLLLEKEESLMLHKLKHYLEPAIKAVMASEEKSDKLLAMKASVVLDSSAILPETVALLSNEINSSYMKPALKVLLEAPKESEATLATLAQNQSLSLSQKLDVLLTYNLVNQQAASVVIRDEFANGRLGGAAALVSQLSYSEQGAQTLVGLVESGNIKMEEIDAQSASRLENLIKGNATADKIIAQGQHQDRKKREESKKKIAQYTKAYHTMKGNPDVGKAIFTSCLVCHAVGDQGYKIAPALDGSASRELEDILTAVVDPDAATEIGYNLYRVVRKDGTMVEGFMERRDHFGIVMKMMGDVKTFVPGRDIKSAQQVRGKSFMPNNFNNFPDQVMVDLVTYIKSLE